jgi:hypothetical protein
LTKGSRDLFSLQEPEDVSWPIFVSGLCSENTKAFGRGVPKVPTTRDHTIPPYTEVSMENGTIDRLVERSRIRKEQADVEAKRQMLVRIYPNNGFQYASDDEVVEAHWDLTNGGDVPIL